MYIESYFFCLLRAVVDPTTEGCNETAVDFLISNLLKRALTKHKEGQKRALTLKKIKALNIMTNLKILMVKIITCI